MEPLFLIEPCAEYRESIAAFRQENLLSDDEDAFAGCGNLEDCETPEEWIESVALGSRPETCPEGRVPSNIYLGVRKRDNKVVGVIDLRHHIDHPILGSWGGHIGYYVVKAERRKGYARQMLQLCLEKCRQRGIPKVMITCSRTNEASERTIRGAGGVYEKDVEVDGRSVMRFWIDLSLPVKLQQLVQNKPFTRDSVGLSGAEVRLYEDMVLKIRPLQAETETEATMLRWLQGKLPAPQLLFHTIENGTEYLLMSRIPGKMLCHEDYMQSGRGAVRLMAQALLRLWSISPEGCPAVHSLDKTLQIAARRIETGEASMEEASPGVYGENGFSDPRQLLKWLEENRPQEELVLSHGDYCMPNLLFTGQELSGYIDLGSAGLADRWEDIAMAHRSLRCNFGGVFGGKVYPDFDPDWLFEELGIEKDEEKFRYYDLLHELY